MGEHVTRRGERVSYDGLSPVYVADCARREQALARRLVGAALQYDMPRDLRETLKAAQDALAKAELARTGN